MIRFGARLTLRGGREALTRLVIICVAVAIGTGLLLSTLGGINAVHHQNNRFAWLETSAGATVSHQAVPGVDPVWWRLSADEYQGRPIGRVDVAGTGPNAPVPPGLTRLPSVGEYYASPALARLIRSTPTAQLADRYSGHLVGEIGDAGLPAPDSLVVVVGRSVHDLRGSPNAEQVSRISTVPPDQCNGACYDIGYNSNSMDLILAVVTAAILFPVVIFIGTATRLSAARREQRFAAMRLVGATPRQIAVIATVESTLAATIGVIAGFGLFFVFRPVLAAVPFTGNRFFPSDLTLSLVDVLAVVIGVPLAAALAARFALRRVIVSPLGISRRTTPRSPSPWRLLVLLAALLELTWFVVAGRPRTTGDQILVYTSGVIATMVGLVLAGPWLTSVGSRLLAGRAQRPAALVAARRLGDDPRAGFRAVSGLVVSLFVGTVAIGIIISIGYGRGSATAQSPTARATLIADLTSFAGPRRTTPVRQLPSGLLGTVRSTPGVRGTLELHATPTFGRGFGPDLMIADCTGLRSIPALGRCTPGAETAQLTDPGFGGSAGANRVWPASDRTAAQLSSLPVAVVAVATDGAPAALETARTKIELALPSSFAGLFPPLTIHEEDTLGQDSQRAAGYQRLADIVIIISLPIAGCTLAVSVVNGINERRRAFSLLRLTGAPLATLRRVIMLEATVPLLLGALASIGIGFLTAFLFLNSQLNVTLQPPGPGYYACVVGGVLISLAIIGSTLPILARSTGPEAARND